MLKRFIITLSTLFATVLILSACGNTASAGSSGTTLNNAAVQPTLPAVANGEAGGEGGVEAALVTYADAKQGFAIGHPGPWTQDTSVTDGAKFVGGDDSMTVSIVTPPTGMDAMRYAKADETTLQTSFPGFKQVGLAPSTEIKNALVQGFEAAGTSAVTGKAYLARADRYYMPMADGRIAVLTVIGPSNHYDREGVRDIALTFKTTK